MDEHSERIHGITSFFTVSICAPLISKQFVVSMMILNSGGHQVQHGTYYHS